MTDSSSFHPPQNGQPNPMGNNSGSFSSANNQSMGNNSGSSQFSDNTQPQQQSIQQKPPSSQQQQSSPFSSQQTDTQQQPFPSSQQLTSPPPPPPPPQEEDNTPANYIIGTKLPPVIDIRIPANNLSFDGQYFLRLLAGSISLSKDEKLRIIESIPRLQQSQIDELIRIFEEEKRKFAELSAKHVDQLQKLEKEHAADWQDIELQQKAVDKKKQDEAKAQELRKKLGL